MTTKLTITEIATRVRKTRKAKGLSQTELAQQVGVTQATIQKIETCRSKNSRYLPIVWAGLGQPLAELDSAFKANGAAAASDPLYDEDRMDRLEDLANANLETALAVVRELRALRKMDSER